MSSSSNHVGRDISDENISGRVRAISTELSRISSVVESVEDGDSSSSGSSTGSSSSSSTRICWDEEEDESSRPRDVDTADNHANNSLLQQQQQQQQQQQNYLFSFAEQQQQQQDEELLNNSIDSSSNNESKNNDANDAEKSTESSTVPPPTTSTSGGNNDNNDDTVNNNASNSTAVPTEQERQILLLMLLAQVCALHDPTPRTFTVHVLELFERGILDRQSIRFLYDLGLVPNSSPTNTSSSPIKKQQQTLLLEADPSARTDTAAAAATTTNSLAIVPAVSAMNNNQHVLLQQQHQRSIEASAIRNRLVEHEERQQQQRAATLLKKEQQTTQPLPNNNRTNASRSAAAAATSSSSSLSWSVEEHPLSLSRYQREFTQIKLLNSGSFGEVFEAQNNMDRKCYAVKRVPFANYGYSKDAVQQVVREVHCLASCDHPNVVRYYTSWLEPSWMTGDTGGGGRGGGQQQRGGGGNQPQKQKHMQLQLTDIQHMVASGGEGSETLSDDLRAYFLDESSSSTRHNGRLRRTFSESSIDFDDDASASSWGEPPHHLRHQHHHNHDNWIGESKDDLFVSSRGNSPRSRVEFLEDDDEEEDNVRPRRRSSSSNNRPHYRYQICLFIQMQLCHPATLADWIRARNQKFRDGSLMDRVESSVEVFNQIVNGLAHVHDKGIIHRDLKPNNIFATADGLHFTIGDFGLSKLIANASQPKTEGQVSSPHRRSGRFQRQQQLMLLEYANNGDQTNGWARGSEPSWQDPLTAGVGTASYASPEQVATRTYGTGADIFSLGLILLELLCSFSTEHERLQTFKDCRQRRVIPTEFNSFPVVAQTILACTEPNAKRRPTANELSQLDLKADILQQKTKTQSLPLDKDSELKALREQLSAKEQELQECRALLRERDRTIEELRYEVEDLRRSGDVGPSYQPPISATIAKVEDDSLEEPASCSSSSSSEVGI